MWKCVQVLGDRTTFKGPFYMYDLMQIFRHWKHEVPGSLAEGAPASSLWTCTPRPCSQAGWLMSVPNLTHRLCSAGYSFNLGCQLISADTFACVSRHCAIFLTRRLSFYTPPSDSQRPHLLSVPHVFYYTIKLHK